jgi:hypothetical protein
MPSNCAQDFWLCCNECIHPDIHRAFCALGSDDCYVGAFDFVYVSEAEILVGSHENKLAGMAVPNDNRVAYPADTLAARITEIFVKTSDVEPGIF